MYSPLPTIDPTSQSSHPITTSKIAPVLRGVIRLYNAVLALLGIVLLGCSTYMYLTYHRTGYTPPSPSPSSSSPLTTAHNNILYSSSSSSNDSSLWFVYTTGILGIFLLSTSLSGMHGLFPERKNTLSLHISMLAVLVLIEAAVVVVLFTDNSWIERLPADRTGWWDRIINCINTNTDTIKIISLSLICTQVACLAFASWLHSINQAAYDDWIDGIEQRQARTREILNRTIEQTYAGGVSSSPWSQRMREKYGVNSGEWEENARQVRRAARVSADDE